MRPVWIRALLALAGGLVAGTLCWIMFGLLTPGDHFANGYRHVKVTAGITALAGALVAVRVRSRTLLILLIAAAVACGLFWRVVPNRWWAKAPPNRGLTSVDQ
jgi:hypothetical protein